MNLIVTPCVCICIDVLSVFINANIRILNIGHTPTGYISSKRRSLIIRQRDVISSTSPSILITWDTNRNSSNTTPVTTRILPLVSGASFPANLRLGRKGSCSQEFGSIYFTGRPQRDTQEGMDRSSVRSSGSYGWPYRRMRRPLRRIYCCANSVNTSAVDLVVLFHQIAWATLWPCLVWLTVTFQG